MFFSYVPLLSMTQRTVFCCAGGSSLPASVFRSFRLLRVLKLAKSVRSLRTLLATVADSVSDVAYLTILLLLFVFIIAVFGMQGGSLGHGSDVVLMSSPAGKVAFRVSSHAH